MVDTVVVMERVTVKMESRIAVAGVDVRQTAECGPYQRELFPLVRLDKRIPQFQGSGTQADESDNGYR